METCHRPTVGEYFHAYVARARFYKGLVPVLITIGYAVLLSLLFGLFFGGEFIAERESEMYPLRSAMPASASSSDQSGQGILKVTPEEIQVGLRALTTGEGMGDVARITSEKMQQIGNMKRIDGIAVTP